MDTTRLIASLVAMGAGASAFGQTYRVIDLGTLYGWAEARALNDDQVVVGSSIATHWQYRGLRWFNALTPIEPLAPYTQSEAMDINALSKAVFASYSMGDVNARAVLLSGTQTTDLGSFVPRAINNAGAVVGTASVTGADGMVTNTAVVWNAGTLTTLPTLTGGSDATALDIADTGDIVGSAFASNAMTPTGVLWRGGAIVSLGSLGGAFSQATGISPSGQYVCGVAASSTAGRRAFRYRMSGTTVAQRLDLGTISGGANSWSAAYDANNSGHIVGTSDGRAFYFDGTTLRDLNTLIDPASGWTLIGATGINSQGEIVGWGDHGAYGLRGFLLAQPCSAADIAARFGTLNTDDFFFYLTQYAAGNFEIADLTTTAIPGAPGFGVPNGILNSDDFFYYLLLYAAGC